MRLAGSFLWLLTTVLLGRFVSAAPTTKPKPRTLTMPIRSLHRSVDTTADPVTIYQQSIRKAQSRYQRIAQTISAKQQTDINRRYNTPVEALATFKANAQSDPNQLDVVSPVNDSANAGVSPLDIQAAISGGITPPTGPIAANSIGLGIVGPDTGYIGIVEIGTPPRQFQILMDSGSADFWVGSETCQVEGGGGCGNHQFLGSQSSSSFVASQQPFNVTYGTGNVVGNLVEDNVVLAGLSLPSHPFGVANVESSNFAQASFDGLMGLAQSGLSQQKLPTPVESLAAAGVIDQAIVAYKISRLADEKNDGEITFGGLDPTKFQSDTLVQLPNVNQQGFWEIQLDAVSVNDQNLGFVNQTAILDTGTTLFVAPPDVVNAIHAQIPGAVPSSGGFTVPCTTNASVALTIGNSSFAIDPHDIAFLPVNPNEPAGACTSGIVSSGTQSNRWLVGDVFLKNAYFATHVNDNLILLAQLS
ncbi:hypothetical protein Clacol_000004 [Clathrus columnatus]|uniref:Peptidase A1 domain-containing protein n=1 Tax=Clathrus columnatus TaxID=1419009 RepID=A0AAV4ZXW3_9AGAM|nr:hypothetical protein Clacol_000004 [Clathrus columnatus]